jgi:phosphoribosylglycinamide formyltransferase-1
MKKIAIFASGSGSNAENIINYFRQSETARVEILLCNSPTAEVIQRAQKLNVTCQVFNRQDFYESNKIETLLIDLQSDLIVLAGFLWLLPEKFVSAFPNKIINIHPALLPKHGGKGYYGMKVHESVLSSKEQKSGITIHYVNDKFDEGKIIAQYQCPIDQKDTAESLAAKIHQLEYKYYPKVIEQLLKD